MIGELYHFQCSNLRCTWSCTCASSCILCLYGDGWYLSICRAIQSCETPIAGSAPSILNLSEAIACFGYATSLVGCWISPKISPLLHVAPKTHGWWLLLPSRKCERTGTRFGIGIVFLQHGKNAERKECCTREWYPYLAIFEVRESSNMGLSTICRRQAALRQWFTISRCKLWTSTVWDLIPLTSSDSPCFI